MRSAITVSLVPEAKGGPFVYSDGLESAAIDAAALGFDALEIFPPGADALASTGWLEVLRANGLRAAAVGTGAGWVARGLNLTLPEGDRRLEARAFIREIIAVAARAGAPAILGSMQGRCPAGIAREQALSWLGEALEDLGEFASGLGVTLLYEPLNRYETNLFHRLGEAAAWLRTLRTRNVRLLADLFHMNIEEVSLEDAVREAGSLIGHVHFADSNRRAVGFGHTDVVPVIAALREVEYDGYLSAEVLPWPDPSTAARQTRDAFLRATTPR